MNELSELTAKEKYHVSLYNNPKQLFRRTLVRHLTAIVPSVGFMIVWLVTREPAYAVFGYGMLLYHSVQNILFARRGIQTASRVFTKYEKEPHRTAAPANGGTAPPAEATPS